MFGIGMQEIMVLMIIALVVIGPKKLPEVAKALGKGYAEFRRAFEDMRNTINLDMDMEADKEKLRKVQDAAPPPSGEPPPQPEAVSEPPGKQDVVDDSAQTPLAPPSKDHLEKATETPLEEKRPSEQSATQGYDTGEEEIEGGGD